MLTSAGAVKQRVSYPVTGSMARKGKTERVKPLTTQREGFLSGIKKSTGVGYTPLP
jgi:hypothetical protein